MAYKQEQGTFEKNANFQKKDSNVQKIQMLKKM